MAMPRRGHYTPPDPRLDRARRPDRCSVSRRLPEGAGRIARASARKRRQSAIGVSAGRSHSRAAIGARTRPQKLRDPVPEPGCLAPFSGLKPPSPSNHRSTGRHPRFWRQLPGPSAYRGPQPSTARWCFDPPPFDPAPSASGPIRPGRLSLHRGLARHQRRGQAADQCCQAPDAGQGDNIRDY